MLNATKNLGLVGTFARTCQSENFRDIWNSEYLRGFIKTNQTSWESRKYVGDDETHTVLWTGNVMG
jgi:hypothetical protein